MASIFNKVTMIKTSLSTQKEMTIGWVTPWEVLAQDDT